MGLGYGCAVACAYCYVGGLHLGHRRSGLARHISDALVNMGVTRRSLRFGDYVSIVDADATIAALRREVAHYAPSEVYCSTLDPFDGPVRSLTLKALPILFDAGHRVTLTSKLVLGSSDRAELQQIFSTHPEWRDRLRLGPSVGDDDATARVLERRAAGTNARFGLAAFAREIGARVIVNLAPLHPGLSDDVETLERLIGMSAAYNADIYIETVNPKPDLDAVVEHYAFAAAGTTEPDTAARLWGAATLANGLRGKDLKAWAAYTYEIHSRVEKAVSAVGSNARVRYWPDALALQRMGADRREALKRSALVMAPAAGYSVPGAADLTAHEKRKLSGELRPLLVSADLTRERVISMMKERAMTAKAASELVRLAGRRPLGSSVVGGSSPMRSANRRMKGTPPSIPGVPRALPGDLVVAFNWLLGECEARMLEPGPAYCARSEAKRLLVGELNECRRMGGLEELSERRGLNLFDWVKKARTEGRLVDLPSLDDQRLRSALVDVLERIIARG